MGSLTSLEVGVLLLWHVVSVVLSIGVWRGKAVAEGTLDSCLSVFDGYIACGMFWYTELSAVWRITLVAMALQGGGVVFSVGCLEEAISLMEVMVGQADLALGRMGHGWASGEGEPGTAVLLEVSVKLGL